MKKYLFLLLVTVSLCHAEKWMLCIGVDKYPQIRDMPQLQNAANDIHYLADIASSSGFSSDKILLLENNHATIQNVHRAFREYLSQATSQDFIVIYFVGHSLIVEQEMHWLLYDSIPEEIDRTSLSHKQLAYLIEKYLNTKQLFVCSDARNSKKSLGPSKNLRKYLPSHEICTLQSSSDYEQSNIKGTRSVFNYFFGIALQNKEYLNRQPDYNHDGVITVFEMSSFLSWAISLSGYQQHPIAIGKNHFPIYRDKLPHLHVHKTKIKNGKCQIIGFVRFPYKLKMRIGQEYIPLAINTSLSQNYNIYNSDQVYWFDSEVDFLPSKNQISMLLEYQQHSFSVEWPLYKGNIGWFGEEMPQGMQKAPQKGVYIWLKDSSLMTYVPAGTSIYGTSLKKIQLLQQQFEETKEELELYAALFSDEKKWKSILSSTLEETNHSILKVNNRMTHIADKIQNLDRESLEKQEINLPVNIAIKEHIQNHVYYKKARSILLQCHNDLQIVNRKLKEIKQDIWYLQKIQKLKHRLYSILGKTVQNTSGYYIDLHEINNRQFRLFCDATSRPYPPTPWWQENYFVDSPDHPVVNVSWEDALAYSLWVKKSLPTEKQWEKAARGEKGNTFPWGEELPFLEITNAVVPPQPDKFSMQLPLFRPRNVASLKKGISPHGCYNMAGNVQEWCANIPNYNFSYVISELNRYRVSKGGSFYTNSSYLATWLTRPIHVETRRSDLGFRCAVSIK